VEKKKMEINREQEKALFAVLFRALIYETDIQNIRITPNEKDRQILKTARKVLIKIVKDLKWERKLTKENCLMIGISPEEIFKMDLKECLKIPIVEQLTG
jgi:hypothetical protein